LSLFSSGVILQPQALKFPVAAAVSTPARLVVIPGLAPGVLTALQADPGLRRMSVLAPGIAAASRRWRALSGGRVRTASLRRARFRRPARNPWQRRLSDRREGHLF